MKSKLLFLTILILLISKRISAETFVVTSNADGGLGTLREAIQKAADNGVNVLDTITFNIADQSLTGRTIMIQSGMPFLTSNLVIDGSTQPGSAIGVSDAKVTLQLSKLVSNLRCFTIRNASNVEIYGLFFYQSYFNIDLGSRNNYSIYFRKANNVIIGRPGKGNYFVGFSKAIANWIDANIPENYLPSDTSNSLTVQANIFGLALNGDLPTRTNTINGVVFTPTEQAVYLRNARDVLIGGMMPSERNHINSPDAITYASDSLKRNGYLKIYGNYIGGVNIRGIIDLNGSSSTTNGKIWIKNTSSIYGLEVLVDIKKNFIAGNIDLGYLSSDAFIQSNTIINPNIFTNNTGDGLYYSSALIKVISQTGKVLIGGDNPAEGNDISQVRYVAPFPLPTYGQYAIQSGASSVLNGAVEIRNNIIHCNTTESSSIYNGSHGLPYRYITDTSTLWVVIDSTANGFVRGRSSYNSRIDIYLDDECRACEGKLMIGSTFSDQNGKWSFSGNFNSVVVATATKRNNTYGFSTPVIITDSVKERQPTCKIANGYIKGLKIIGGDNFEWRYSGDGIFGNSVFHSNTSLDITNLKPGVYWIMGKLGSTCYGWKIRFDLRNYSAKIKSQSVQIVNSSCGQFNGSIRNISVDSADYTRFEWRSVSGNAVSITKDLMNIGPGSYKLYAIDTTEAGCIDSSILFTISNQSGPSININNMKITSAICNLANGSISNIQIVNSAGVGNFRWEDSTRKIVGNQIDLLNITGGKYRLKFKDASGCDTITTSFYVIDNKGLIKIDTSGKSIRASGCNLNNGSIKGISIFGANQTIWKDSLGNLISFDADLVNVGAGTFRLFVSNTEGCSLSSPFITVPPSTFIPLNITSSETTHSTCGLPNGSIKSIVFNSNPSQYSFHWKDSLTGTILGTALSLSNLPEGNFILMATDSNGCEEPVFRKKIIKIPKPEFDSSALQITPDICNQSVGSIKNMKFINLSGPATYQWINSKSKAIATTFELLSAPSDNYQLRVTDEYACSITSNFLFIKDSIIEQPTPIYYDTVIARNTAAFLTVKNLTSGTYLLFNDIFSITPIDQNSSGNFITQNLSLNHDFYIQFKRGSCYSKKVKTAVTVVDETKVLVPNVFSPNGDGINDILKINITGLFTLKEFIIYNREGQKMFSTTDILSSWDGRYNGSYVPIGTYYYILKGNDIASNLLFMQGSITILR